MSGDVYLVRILRVSFVIRIVKMAKLLESASRWMVPIGLAAGGLQYSMYNGILDITIFDDNF